MNTLTENELQLIEDAALALGYVPSRYNVRDSTVIYVSRNGSNGRYWNPLDPGRHDFFDIVTCMSLSGRSLELVIEHSTGFASGVFASVFRGDGVPSISALSSSDGLSIPKAFCVALTRIAQKFHQEVIRNDHIQHEPAEPR